MYHMTDPTRNFYGLSLFCVLVSVGLRVQGFESTVNKEFMTMNDVLIGLHHPLVDITNPKYKLLHFLTTNFLQREEGTSF
jgi:hypothetical protein